MTESAGRVRHGLLEDTAPPIGRDDLTGMEEFAVGSEYTQMIEKSCQMMTRGAEERQKTDGLVNIMSWAPDTQRVVRWFMKYFHSSHTKSLRGQTGEHREKNGFTYRHDGPELSRKTRDGQLSRSAPRALPPLDIESDVPTDRPFCIGQRDQGEN